MRPERVNFEKEIVTKAQGRYKTRVFNSDGSLDREEYEWKPNLILNCGLDKIANMPWANVFQFAVAGTGTTPTKVDTQSTASQASATVTINSGGYTFSPSIVGKLLYWPGTNSYANVTAYINASSVTVAETQTVANASFYVYNVDQTALDQPYSMHCRYVPGSGLCGTEIENNTIRMLRTYDFYVQNTPVLITEVGFKDQPAEPKLFSRVVLQEPQYLAAGQYFQISYELSVTVEPASATSRAVEVSGWPIAPSVSTVGTEQIQRLGMAIVDLSGVTHVYDESFVCNEPFAPGTHLLGPQYGYCNRWSNGAGDPLKNYGALSANPFAYKRNYVEYYLDSPTGSYLPRVSAAALNGVTYGVVNDLIDNDVDMHVWPQWLLSLSAEYMQPVVGVPAQWGRITPSTTLSAFTWTPTASSYLGMVVTSGAYVSSGSVSGWKVNVDWPAQFKSDVNFEIVAGQLFAADINTPVTYSASTTYANFLTTVAWPTLSSYVGDWFNFAYYRWLMPPYDPYSPFPNPVYPADFDWTNWTETVGVLSAYPVRGSSVFISTVSSAPAAFLSNTDRSATSAVSCVEIPLTLVPYVSGSFERIKKATYMTNLANGNNWRSIGVGPTDNSINITDRTLAAKYNGYVFVFDEPQTKYPTHILNVFFKYTWRRDLST
jgi:hypothetical protein